MSRLYTLTKDNYKEVLEKIQKISNTWYLLQRYECFKINKRTKKDKYPEKNRSVDIKSWENER